MVDNPVQEQFGHTQKLSDDQLKASQGAVFGGMIAKVVGAL